MKKDNLHSKNAVFLAKWLEDELTDTELKSLVTEKEFLVYKKIKQIGILSKKLKPKSDSFNKVQQKIRFVKSNNQNKVINLQKPKVKVRKLYTKWAVTVAASLLFFIGFYTFLERDSVLNKSDFGQQKTVLLLDGSEVILNAKSALSYTKKDWANKREVYLNGEAFFKVKKGSVFTVRTKNGNITVLGTQFKVNAIADYFEVVCYEGSVKVFSKNFNEVLKPNNAFRKINDNTIEKWQLNLSKPTWVNGESTFKSVPLKYVISKLEKQYASEIDASKIDSTLIFTGSFSHQDIDIALASVFGATNIKYEKIINSKKIILSMN
ncbi:MAG: FecR family protein [Flavobacteriaceae bacterium]|nr:FecR family protein [Flavobacteriaceae bacterium]